MLCFLASGTPKRLRKRIEHQSLAQDLGLEFAHLISSTTRFAAKCLRTGKTFMTDRSILEEISLHFP